MKTACPKCASFESHSAGLESRSDPLAPREKHVFRWLILAVICGTWFLERLPDLDWQAWLMAIAAASTAAATVRGYRYNTYILPQVAAAWDVSRICGLCGNVFVPASYIESADLPSLSRDLRLIKTKQ
ncbi:MAG TPA: hypothetical protein VM939_06735 [Gemmatimonadaceae bacterium]|nr:hypothetical protein [Gemmatimonadaceae bacterium]